MLRPLRYATDSEAEAHEFAEECQRTDPYRNPEFPTLYYRAKPYRDVWLVLRYRQDGQSESVPLPNVT